MKVSGNYIDYNGMLTGGLLFNCDTDYYKMCVNHIDKCKWSTFKVCDCHYLSVSFNFSYEIVIEVSIDRYRMLHIAPLFIWAYWLVRLPELWRPGYYYVIWFSIPNYNRPQHAGSRKCLKSIKSPLSTPWMLPGPLELPVDLFNKQFPLWFLAFGEGVRIPPNPS